MFYLLWLLLPCLLPGVQGVKVHSLHWNSTNPIFRIDNTDHIVDVNSGNEAWEYDQLEIICPVGERRGTRSGKEGEKYIIYNVSKEEYDTCRISQAEPRVVAVCDKPDRQLQFTITFRSFSPTPRGLEFRPGQDYYFISTSSRRDLNRRAGGSCATHNMKVIFKVAERGQEHGLGQRQGQGQPAINRPRERVEEEHVKPIERVGSFHTGLGQKREEGRRGTVKQEASTMSGSRSREQHSFHLLLPFLLMLLSATT